MNDEYRHVVKWATYSQSQHIQLTLRIKMAHLQKRALKITYIRAQKKAHSFISIMPFS